MGVEIDYTLSWPDVDGIDRADARSRWCGDVILFKAMLGRFLIEYADIGLIAAGATPSALIEYGRRMHRLRGAACTLGATSIQELAGRIEEACTAIDGDRAVTLTERLTGELERIQVSAKPAFAPVANDSEAGAEALLPEAAADPRLIVELDALLRQHSLGARDCFRAISCELRQRFGQESYCRMRGFIDGLQFEDAARELRRVVGDRRPTGKGGELSHAFEHAIAANQPVKEGGTQVSEEYRQQKKGQE